MGEDEILEQLALFPLISNQNNVGSEAATEVIEEVLKQAYV